MSKVRTPMRLLAMPSRTPLRGNLCFAKKTFSASPSASGSRNSPPTTMPGASASRATCCNSTTPLFETRAAAICDAPILRPTSFFAAWPPLRPPPEEPFGSEGFENETCFFQNGCEAGFAMTAVGASLGASAAAGGASGARDLRPNESSFFQNGPESDFGARSSFGVFVFFAFGVRESESSFFQKGSFGPSASGSGGSAAAGTGGCTRTAAAVSEAGGSSGAESHGSTGSGAATGSDQASATGSTATGSTATGSTAGSTTEAARIPGESVEIGPTGASSTGRTGTATTSPAGAKGSG